MCQQGVVGRVLTILAPVPTHVWTLSTRDAAVAATTAVAAGPTQITATAEPATFAAAHPSVFVGRCAQWHSAHVLQHCRFGLCRAACGVRLRGNLVA